MRRAAILIILSVLNLAQLGFIPDQQAQVIRVGLYQNSPKIFTDENGAPAGFWVDIVKAIAARADYRLEWVPGTWEENLERLEAGEIDVLPDVGWTEERSNKFVLSGETVLTSWARIYVQSGSDIETILDLDGKRVAGLEGALNFDGPEGIKALAESFGVHCTFLPFRSYNEVFSALGSHLVDAGVTNKDFGDANEKTYGVARTPILLQPTTLVFAFPRNGVLTTELSIVFDENIQEMKADPTSVYYKALDRYFGQGIEETFFEKIPTWLIQLLLISAAAILFAVVYIYVSRRQISAQTAELRESEKRYQMLATVAPVGIFHTNDSGSTTYVNPAWCQITGMQAADALGDGWLKAVHPDDRENLASRWRETARLHTPSFTDYRFIHHTGSIVWVMGQAVPEMDEKGRLVGFVGTITDITERKKIESLQLEVARAESADRLKSAFLATMSHELRTPLNSIIGFTGILLQKMVGPLEMEQEKQLRIIQSSAQHLLELINDVLDISKIEAGQVVTTKQPFGMEVAVRKSLEKIQPLADRKGLSLKIMIEPEKILINSDRRRVEQVLINLLNNAVKFTEAGEVRLTCSIEGGQVLTRIIDTGIGIREEDIPTLFKPFQQVDDGITRQYDGTGLGLSICQRLVTMLGGKIWVESKLGSGSTFAFTLPLEEGTE